MDEYRRRQQERYRAEGSAGDRAKQPPPPPPPRRAAAAKQRPAAQAAGGGEKNLIDRAEDLMREYGVRHLLTERNIMLAAGCLLAVVILSQHLVAVMVLALLAAYLAQNIPTDESFNDFFKTWFLEDVYPRSSKQYRERKWSQRPNADPISNMIGSVKSWVHEKTEGVHGIVAYEAVRLHALPARIDRYPCWKVAYCHLDPPDQRDQQGAIVFIGVGNRWFHNPLQTLLLE